jgi:MtfA peptidase
MRRRRALSTPFPDEWRKLLADRLSWYENLDGSEHARLEDLTRLFLASTRFEEAGGLKITDEIQAVIAYQASLLVLGLDADWYRHVTSVIVYPSTIVRKGARGIGDGVIDDRILPLSGEARLHGPVVIVWDMALHQARHPERGHNVVFHEFAHTLDMFDGAADGMPALRDRDAEQEWQRVMAHTLHRLRTGHGSPLDPYGATNPAELFAVATEAFFDTPLPLRQALPDLYDILSGFYQQDPAARASRPIDH